MISSPHSIRRKIRKNRLQTQEAPTVNGCYRLGYRVFSPQKCRLQGLYTLLINGTVFHQPNVPWTCRKKICPKNHSILPLTKRGWNFSVASNSCCASQQKKWCFTFSDLRNFGRRLLSLVVSGSHFFVGMKWENRFRFNDKQWQFSEVWPFFHIWRYGCFQK